MANINTQDVSKSERAIIATYKSLLAFGYIFLDRDFRKSPTPLFHKEIAKEMMARSVKPLALILPRRSAKTTLTKAFIIRNLVFSKKAYEWGLSNKEEDLFYGWCSASQSKSIRNVEYVKHHLQYNSLLKYYFGSMKGPRWNQEDITTRYGDRLISTSNLTSLRGDTIVSIYGETIRYSSVFIDDPESEQNTVTSNSRAKINDNIFNGIIPAIVKDEPGKTLFYSGTPVHFDSFCQKLLEKWMKKFKECGGIDALNWTNDPEQIEARKKAIDEFNWRIITYRSTQPELEGGVLWYPWNSKSTLEREKATARMKGDPSSYFQEYELEVQSEEDSLIGRKLLKYYDGYYEHSNGVNYIIIDNERRPVNTFIGCDPSTDIITKNSSFSVVMVIAIDSRNNCYVLDYERHRGIPTVGSRTDEGIYVDKKGVVDYLIDLYEKYHCRHAEVEDVAMNRSIFNALNDEKRKRNKYHIVVLPEKPVGQGDKLNRIYTGLASRFSSGRMFVKESHYSLIDEVVKFGPKMGANDCLDALYYACHRAYPIYIKSNYYYDSDYRRPEINKDWQTL